MAATSKRYMHKKNLLNRQKRLEEFRQNDWACILLKDKCNPFLFEKTIANKNNLLFTVQCSLWNFNPEFPVAPDEDSYECAGYFKDPTVMDAEIKINFKLRPKMTVKQLEEKMLQYYIACGFEPHEG